MPAVPAVIPARAETLAQGLPRPSAKRRSVPRPDCTKLGGRPREGRQFPRPRAEEAAGLGWTTLGLFGVHPQIGLARPDSFGVVVSGDKVSAITATRIIFVNTGYYRDTPGQPRGAVPIWLFGR